MVACQVRGASGADRARDRRPRPAGRSLGGLDRARPARGVVRDGSRARRPARRRGRLPVGGRRGAPRRRAGSRARRASRPRLGRRRRDRARARGGRRRHPRARDRDRAALRRRPRGARTRARVRPVDLVFDALGDASRRALVEAVAARGTATATQLASELPVTRQAVAKQLGLLADAGLLRATRAGRETRYEVTPEPLGEAVAWMVDVGAAWDDRLARLGAVLARGTTAR